jgi:gamma-glutamyl-gamma-aminobutyrate hydrolase PuuD
MTNKPLIGIAVDITEPRQGRPRAECSLAYADAVARAGGLPVYLAPVPGDISEQLAAIDGFVLTGGDDPRMEPFGEPTHPQAKPVHPLRQTYETELLRALLARPEIPVLGICLGMQMMAIVAGGRLDQHLPDHLTTAEDHRHDQVHRVRPTGAAGPIAAGPVTSSHRQAVADPGSFRVVAMSDDGVIEAIECPDSRFCLGVQWHPERTADAALGDGLFVKLVQAATEWRRARANAV